MNPLRRAVLHRRLFTDWRTDLRTDLRAVVAAAALGAACGAAPAQVAGTWVLRGGVAVVAPDVTSGSLTAPSVANLKVDVDDATTVLLGATYFLDDDLSFDLAAGLPFKHELSGAGAAAGAGRLATVRVAAPGLTMQYRFRSASDALRPYVGGSLVYAHFYDEEGTSALTALSNPGGPPTGLAVDAAVGAGLQFGASLNLHGGWFLDANLSKLFLKTTATLSTGQTLDIELNPLITTLSLGYRY